MIEPYETGTLAETQDQVCIDLAKSIKEWMMLAPIEGLSRASITETVPPDPFQNYEHELTAHYLLKPFTPHSGLVQKGATWMLRMHAYDGMPYHLTDSLAIVSVPVDEDGHYQFPEKLDGWQEVFEVSDYVGVLNRDRTKPNDDDITICRLLLEDANTTIAERKLLATEPAAQ